MTIKKLNIFIILALFSGLCLASQEQCDIRQFLREKLRQQSQPKKTTRAKKEHEHVFSFNFSNVPLVDVINELAAASKLNILLPQGAFAINSKLTYHIPEKITLIDAWEKLQFILGLAGYTIKPKNDDILMVVKNDATIKREAVPIYINASLLDIPSSDQIIRSVFFLGNIRLKLAENSIRNILTDMLTKDAADIKLDSETNALILTDKANNIKAAMKIILELDQGGTRDAVEVLPLYYTSAQLVQELFNQLRPEGQQQTTPFGPPPPPQKQANYFPKNTKVIALDRLNSIVVMGTTQAIHLVKDFIFKYIDRPLESGDSILHVYDLQYLDAEKFAPSLEKFLKPPSETPEQARGKTTSGPKQYFKDVIVVAEKTRRAEAIKPTELKNKTAAVEAPAEGVQQGGNRIVVAARQKDWLRIKELIQKLDTPQPQIAIEVLVLDINVENDKILGNQMRNKAGFNDSFLSNHVNFQTAHLNQPVLKSTNADGQLPADALMANLLELMTTTTPFFNIATQVQNGSALVSFTDGTSGVWSLWQILNKITSTNIIAQPFVVVRNNEKASTVVKDERYNIGSAADAEGGAIAIPNEYIEAAITLDIKPRISHKTGTINLEVVVQINEFTDSTSLNRMTRYLQTNANLGNGEVLALGGLTRTREEVTIRQTPLLSRIPLLGWFFKREEKVKQRNMLAVFLSPGLISPMTRGGADTFTQRKLEFSKNNLEENLTFENLRDPITRWFFQPNVDYPKNTLDRFTSHATYPVLPDEPAIVIEDKRSKELKKLIKDTDNPLKECLATTK